jgi:hypothetical protein
MKRASKSSSGKYVGAGVELCCVGGGERPAQSRQSAKLFLSVVGIGTPLPPP